MKQEISFSSKVFCLFSFFIFLLSCSTPTDDDKKVTFSGTVTLEGETDRSGVTVMLFKPIELDTALTNLNAQYPGIGIEINQRTEFFWREHRGIPSIILQVFSVS